MKQDKLNEILRLHKLWIEGKDGGAQADLACAYLEGANLGGADLLRANLAGADLEGANLRGADLLGANLRAAHLPGANLSKANLGGACFRWADLSETDLAGANLSGANLDYACWPLWCGSLTVKICSRIAAQLVYHVVRACQSVKDDADVVAFCRDPIVIKLANRFHRADECGKIEANEGGAK